MRRFTFADLEDSFDKFSGEGDGKEVLEWIEDFEATAESFGLSELDKYVFGRRLVIKTAKDFLRSSVGLNSWEKLRDALQEEFEVKLTSKQIHKMLEKRKKKSSETLRQYLYAMNEIAKKAPKNSPMEEESVCSYIVDGIQDSPQNKMNLYKAKTIKSLKEKLEDYEVMRDRMGSTSSTAEKVVEKHEETRKGKVDEKSADKSNEKEKSVKKEKKRENSDGIRCYNCGKTGHYASECETKEQGPKCFNCNGYGHKAKDCKVKKGESAQICEVKLATTTLPVVKVCVQTDVYSEVNSLFDTGSSLNLIREDFHAKIGSPSVQASKLFFTGLGGVRVKSKGVVTINMCIEGIRCDQVEFHVVPTNAMQQEMLLGIAILKFINVEISVGDLKISAIKENIPEVSDSENNSAVSEMMNILVNCENDDLDVPEKYYDTVREMINNYVPDQNAKCNVVAKIVMTDEAPISCNPRRFSEWEQELIDKQVDEWLVNGKIRESTMRPNQRFDVTKVSGEGPNATSTTTSHVKKYQVGDDLT
ncbi:hypothetical protein DMENIID0001_167470 [Sergentomyia squamirostris]